MDKILVYNESFFEISQTFVYHQILGLSKQFNVELLSYKFKNPHGFNVAGFEKHKINIPHSFIDRVVSKIYRELTESPLHVTLTSHLLLRNLFENKQYRAIHAHFGYNGLDILDYAKKYNIPLVVTFHGHDASAMLKNDEYRRKLPELFDYVSGIHLVSEHMISKLGVEKWIDKVEVIPCAVDPSEFDLIGESSIQSSKKIKIVHAGRITGKKGVPDLIKVFAKLNKRFDNIELHIAGNGEEYDECLKLAKRFNLENDIKFYGSVTHNQIKSILKNGDIFVLNSRISEEGDMEGTPVTLLEAMCLGKAVVSTNHAGIPYVIDDGINGLLVEEKNNGQLEKALSAVIKFDEMRAELGTKAKKTIHASYTMKQMQEKIESLILKAIKSTESSTEEPVS